MKKPLTVLSTRQIKFSSLFSNASVGLYSQPHNSLKAAELLIIVCDFVAFIVKKTYHTAHAEALLFIDAVRAELVKA